MGWPGPLRHSPFRVIWATTVLSQLGSFIQIVAISWTMASLSASAAMVALVQTAANFPMIILAVAAGALADMFDRRHVMLAAQFLMLLLSLGLALCAFLDMLTPVLLLSFTFLIGCGTALHAPAWQASVGELVPRNQISSAVATNVFGNNIARSIGPALGGAIVSVAGAGVAFAINAFSYVGVIAVLLRWKGPGVLGGHRPNFIQMVSGGFGYALAQVRVRNLFLRTFAFGFGAAAIWAFMPLVAIRLGGGAQLLGVLFACFGVGAMFGAIASIAIRNRYGIGALVDVSVMAVALPLFLLGLTRSVPIAVFAHLLAGAGWVAVLSTFNVSVQLAVARSHVGRTLAIYQMMAFGGVALGSATWGVMADYVGMPAALVAAGAFLAMSGLFGALFALPAPTTEQED
ncbi:MFS transporter [Sneathiella sp.]|uniref:MFS transporter n=1 Tax=Sneathiella sp. TaxID=1964365 RepID=UPI00356AC7EC